MSKKYEIKRITSISINDYNEEYGSKGWRVVRFDLHSWTGRYNIFAEREITNE